MPKPSRIRQKHSHSLLKLLQNAITPLLVEGASILPKCHLGQALRYAQGQWTGVSVYLEHEEVENTIRATTVGKENCLFIGHLEAEEWSVATKHLR